MFTLEVMLRRTEHNAKLLNMTLSLGYNTFLVREQCGVPVGCRNLIFVPNERMGTGAVARLAAATVVIADASELIPKGRFIRARNATRGDAVARKGARPPARNATIFSSSRQAKTRPAAKVSTREKEARLEEILAKAARAGKTRPANLALALKTPAREAKTRPAAKAPARVVGNPMARCCKEVPEPSRLGRCTWMANKAAAKTSTFCDEKADQASCPVACGRCAICEGHPQFSVYWKIYERKENENLRKWLMGAA